MSSPGTLLDQLHSRTTVDCDTLDEDVAKELGPFQDCTSNQIIAYNELLLHRHADILKTSGKLAIENHGQFKEVSMVEIAVEIAMTSLALMMIPHIKGFAHVQTNTMYANSKERTVDNARRIIHLVNIIDPPADAKRICIKVPSTWEGLQACRTLEAEGIATLATTLFAMPQAVLAGEVKCTYIAPYVYDLRAQVDPAFRDTKPLFYVPVAAQSYYKTHGYHIKVLPASLTTPADAIKLAGADHMTIAPRILREMAAIKPKPTESGGTGSLFDGPAQVEWEKASFVDNEKGFREALKEEDREGRLEAALEIFNKAQGQLETMMAPFCQS